MKITIIICAALVAIIPILLKAGQRYDELIKKYYDEKDMLQKPTKAYKQHTAERPYTTSEVTVPYTRKGKDHSVQKPNDTNKSSVL